MDLAMANANWFGLNGWNWNCWNASAPCAATPCATPCSLGMQGGFSCNALSPMAAHAAHGATPATESRPSGTTCKAGFPQPPQPQPLPAPLPSRRDSDKEICHAIMLVPSDEGTGCHAVYDQDTINELLHPDWKRFLQLAEQAPQGTAPPGTAVGLDDIRQNLSNVLVFFIVSDVGVEGEVLAKQSAKLGARAHLVGETHELYSELQKWKSVAIMRGTAYEAPILRSTKEEDRKNISKIPDGLRQIHRHITYIGSPEGLRDKEAIPKFAEILAKKSLESVGAQMVFRTLADAFKKLKNRVAHKKSIVYTVHQMLMRYKRHMLREDTMQMCVEKFLVKIGYEIRIMPTKEREAYCNLLKYWDQMKVLSKEDLKLVKWRWDCLEAEDLYSDLEFEPTSESNR